MGSVNGPVGPPNGGSLERLEELLELLLQDLDPSSSAVEIVFGVDDPPAGRLEPRLFQLDHRLDPVHLVPLGQAPRVGTFAHLPPDIEEKLCAKLGLGVAAIQLAKQAGATVIGTSSSAEKLARLTELGLDHGVDTGDDAVAEVHADPAA